VVVAGWRIWRPLTIHVDDQQSILLIFRRSFAIGEMGGGDCQANHRAQPVAAALTLVMNVFVMDHVGGGVTLIKSWCIGLRRNLGAPESPSGVGAQHRRLWGLFANDLLTISGP